ncbi:alpha/beta fold hydrolase [Olleya aquimaris]|uniref:Serine aminopeptidase S33 family n=1 Tax=Olleya aquimaris TaxID=639310 RepID=A0A327R899_9FLAO|nr:alpha/beta hydrolase [Olleya aquimaris]RAJ11783.1 serine aminopeptidase S33 family [Olleya aquimaris]
MKKVIAKAVPKIIGSSLNMVSYVAPKYASVKALNLFATPRQGRLNPTQEQFLNTAKQHTLRYNNLDIQTYLWEGSKETVLFAHGWESNSFRWKKLIKTLQAQDYNIVALDGPAHGKSGGKQFNAILYSEFINVVANHYQPDTIVGHSVGGMASVFFQHNYQHSALKKLALLGAPSEFTNVFKNYVNMLGYNSRIENGLNQLVFDRFNYEPSHFSSAKFASKINVEGLIIHDKHDEVIKYDEAELISSNFKNSTLITTEGFGHGLRDNSVNEAIINFIKS